VGSRGYHGDERLQEIYGMRELETEFPAICDLLSPDMNVLDVGCGPGTITVGVAQRVRPGMVTAIDAEQSSLQKAREQAEKAKAENVAFERGDAYSLRFSDGAFDLAYCRHILEWLVDPVRAIQEMMRVTKTGGHVAAQDHDLAGFAMYPSCPTFELIVRLGAETQTDESRDKYEDFHFGRKLFGYFRQAGLRDIQVRVGVHNSTHAGAHTFDRYYRLLRRTAESPLPLTAKLIKDGRLPAAATEELRREIDDWRHHPDAFCMWAPGVFAVGEVP
jgi:ubiquinone/menaquinone biosynthesis C-methylase UbiE